VKEISSMLYRLPAASSPEFSEEFEGSWGGVLLASLFTEILKGSADVENVPIDLVFLILIVVEPESKSHHGYAEEASGHGEQDAERRLLRSILFQ